MKTGVFKDTLGEWLAEAEVRGEARGEARGLVKGRLETARRLTASTLSARFGAEASDVIHTMKRLGSIEVLERLHEVATLCESLEEFRTRLHSEA